ncbi:hypothetical protein [Mycetocola spongiae]|uniref:hypothetical protein n=1 Tax=Mycetocola spongiae TaxID=2859226 RepID=UPI001CF47FE8|nr:hypothetical protein [Mycetocola spongiae]UCR89698.1 hypothetical protein KXZ72_03195 [Mycetocola spongiae]
MTALRERINILLATRWSLCLGLLLLTLVGAAILGPVLFSSVDADDAHWILETPAYTQGSFWQSVVWSFTDVPAQSPDQGRFSQFAYAMQRIMDLATMNLSVALSTPPLVIRAGLKVILLLVAFASILGFARILRRRLPDGRLVGLSRGDSVLFAVILAVLIPLGAKSMMLGSFNGWISYPVLTYGAVPIIFGAGIIMLWLYEGLQRKFVLFAPIAVIVVLVICVFITTSYELYYLVFPMMIVSLLLQPRNPEYSAGRDRSKIFLLATTATLFALAFGVTRLYVATACAAGGCYTGVLAGSVKGTISATVYNLVSSLPGATVDYAGQNALETLGSDPQSPTRGSLLLGILFALGVLLVILWVRRRNRSRLLQAPQERITTEPLYLRLAALSACVALGGAVLMAVSSKAQASLTLWSVPFRSGVLIWFALATMVAALLMYLAGRSPRTAPYIISALALAGAVVIAMATPINYYAAQNARLNQVTRTVDSIHNEVAVGDLSPAADALRCTLISTLMEQVGEDLHGERTISGAYAAFNHYYGVPFCSQLIGPYDTVPTTIY